jgi:hypothetical protein
MDAFERFWQWAEKPLDSSLTISADLHRAVMELTPDDRRDRAKVNEAAGRAESKDRPKAAHQSVPPWSAPANGGHRSARTTDGFPAARGMSQHVKR